MATTKYSNWQAVTRHTARSVHEFVNSNMDVYIADVTIGADEDYATGGIPVEIRGGKKRTKVIAHPLIMTTGHKAVYIESTQKLKVWQSASAELVNNSQALRGAEVQFLVFAR